MRRRRLHEECQRGIAPMNHTGPSRRHETASAALVRLAAAAAVVGLLLLVAPAARGDRIVMKSGETFTGSILEETDDNVVLKTISGKMTIPRVAIKSVEKESPEKPKVDPATGAKTPAAPPPQIVPIPVTADKMDESFKAAKAALVAGDWLKAGGLLEGLMVLDEATFKYDDRLGATGALITCYLQIKDAQGAAKAIARRAQLAKDPNDKRRLAAAGEALRAIGSVEVNGKTLSRFEEVVEAAMAWKAQQGLAAAKDTVAKAQRLNEMAQLEKAAAQALKQLQEADVFQPGFSLQHEKHVLAGFVANILEGARGALEHCEKIRPELTQRRLNLSKAAAQQWNNVAKVYMAKRLAAEQGLKNIKPFTLKFKLDDLYAENESDIKDFLEQLDEYQYYPKGTYFGGYYGYGYGDSDGLRRVKMQLRTF